MHFQKRGLILSEWAYFIGSQNGVYFTRMCLFLFFFKKKKKSHKCLLHCTTLLYNCIQHFYTALLYNLYSCTVIGKIGKLQHFKSNKN